MKHLLGWWVAGVLSIPALASAQGYSYGAPPAAGQTTMAPRPINAPMAGRPVSAQAAPASPNAPRLTSLALPVLGPQPFRVGAAQPTGAAPAPAIAAPSDPLSRPSSPLAAPGETAYGSYGAAVPGRDEFGRRTAGPTRAGTRETSSSRIISSPLITATVLQPVVLEQPREFASAPQALPVISFDAAGILGGFRDALTTTSPDSGSVPGLYQNGLAGIPIQSLALQGLKLDDGQARLASLSLPVLTYAPPGPDAALAGFVPTRVLAWPGGGTRNGFNAAPPAPPAPPAYPGIGNPFGYNSGIGMALNAFSMIGSRLGSGMPSLPGLPGLPGLPPIGR